MKRPLLIDISRILWRRWRGSPSTGIDRACLAYLRHFADRALAVVQRGGFTRVLAPQSSARLATLLLEQRADFRRLATRELARALVGPGRHADNRHGAIYLNVGHTGLDLPGHGRWVHGARVSPIYYVHDIIPITHPHYCRAGEDERHRLRMRAALSLGRGIIANSQDTSEALVDFAQREQIAPPPMLVAPLALSVQRPLGAALPPIAAPYFLMIGTIEGRKNYRLALQAWRRLAARLGEQAPRLVIIGARGWAADDVFHDLDTNALLRRFVIERGACSDAELASYIAHARALLFPSFVEGQGLPLVEALAAGTPAIASDLAVFHEMAGNIPDYLHPEDVDGWVNAITCYLPENSAPRSAQLMRLASFHAPVWEDHFRQVESWIAGLH